jgi:hypothetical protein
MLGWIGRAAMLEPDSLAGDSLETPHQSPKNDKYHWEVGGEEG